MKKFIKERLIMKNMKWKVVFAVFLAAAIFIGVFGVSSAEAEVKITIRNNRSHNMSFAFRWAGFDPYYSKGWYRVNAGETRTITLSQPNIPLSRDSFGYYAMGGGSAWRGNNNDGFEGWIHPTEAFEFEFFPGDNPTQPKSGMQKVFFRKVNLRGTGEKDQWGAEKGAATLTFNP